jgi:ligand-binding sensor domain-containing protein
MNPAYRSSGFRLVGIIAFAFGGGAIGRAADAALPQEPAHYCVDYWREADGLPQSRIRQIVQTRDGYVWLGTDGGLVRFDGVNFTVFDVRSGSLKDNEVWALKEDRDGALWIGTTGGGLTRLKDRKFTTYTTADGLSDDVVRQIDEDPEGRIWVATAHGVTRMGRDGLTVFGKKDGLVHDFVIRINAASPSGVFVVAGSQVQRLVDGRFVVVDGVVGPRDGRVANISLARDGTLWFTCESGVIKLWKDGVVSLGPVEEALVASGARAYDDGAGGIWLGSRDGVYRLENGRFVRAVSREDKARLGTVICMRADREGSLWLGLEANGLARLRRAQFTTLTAEDGLPGDSTRSVFQDSRGDVWIGTTTGFARWHEGQVTPYRELGGSPLATVTSIAEDAHGTIWLAASGELLKFKDGTLTRDPGWKRVFDIKAIYRDPAGRVWVATDGDGLFEFDNDKVTVFRKADGLGSDQVRGLANDRRGALWVTTSGGGVSRYADGRFTTFTTKDGLAGDRVGGVYADDAGALWFLAREGLTRYKNGKFFAFRAGDGLYSSFVSSMLEDGRGIFWFSCSRGLFTVSRADFDVLADGKTNALSSHEYGVKDGLNTGAFGAGVQPTAWRMKDGRLLFCSLKGLVIVDPHHLFSNTLPPPVCVERVTINKRACSPDRTLEVTPGEGEVEIHYAALSYLAPGKVRFKYRLDGFDHDWVDAGTRRFAYYASLPPGRYNFRVVACNADEVWNYVGATFSFVLKPYFRQTIWFYLACLAGLAAVIGAAYELRIMRLRMRERELQQRVDDAVAKVKVLSGMLPLCASCKKVRDDKGYWQQIETYIAEHSKTEVSHGLCPDCVKKLYPDIHRQLLAEQEAAGGPNPNP